MTIEQLLDLPPEGLEGLSDTQLHEMLSPYFQFTRPATSITAVATGRVLKPSAASAARPAGGGMSQKGAMNAMLDRIMAADITPEKLRMMRELPPK